MDDNAVENKVSPVSTGGDENIKDPIGQTDTANIPPVSVEWEGDPRYFQTGKKAGTLKPSHATGGLDAESAVPMFNASGKVKPSGRTKNAQMPTREKKVTKSGTASTRQAPEADEMQVAIANANMVVTALDLLRHGISGGEVAPQDDLRKATVASWSVYLAEQGIKLPSWVQVAVMSSMYVAPAFSTNSGKEKVISVWTKVKVWWIKRGAK
jgi:hypothetical protein